MKDKMRNIPTDWIQFSMFILTIVTFLWIFLSESKEFHGRLCTLEQKYVHIMEKEINRRK